MIRAVLVSVRQHTGPCLQMPIMPTEDIRISFLFSEPVMQRIRDASCDLHEDYQKLKTELANKFDNLKGPFDEGEDAGVFTLKEVPEETYYYCDELTFEEFRQENAGAGYPLKLPLVIDYEQWKEEGKPDDDTRFITHRSSEDLIERLMDVMSRQLEGSVSQNKRDFVNAEQTQTGSSSLSVLTLIIKYGKLGEKAPSR